MIKHLLILLFACLNLSAQNNDIDIFVCDKPNLQLEFPLNGNLINYGGEDGKDFVEVEDGYIIGITSSSGLSVQKTGPLLGEADYWIVKTNFIGEIQWDKLYGGTGFDNLVKIKKLSDGNILLAGHSTSNSSLTKSENSRGSADLWLIKITPSGQILWDKTIGSNVWDELKDVVELPDGSIVAGGSNYNPANGFEKTSVNHGAYYYWIIKLNSSGSIIFDQSYGGGDYDNLNSIILGNNNDLILGGGSYSDNGGNKTSGRFSGGDFWVLSIDFNGSINWQKTFGGDGFDRIISIAKKKSEGYFLVGDSFSNSVYSKTSPRYGERDIWTVFIDNWGNKLFDFTFGGGGRRMV